MTNSKRSKKYSDMDISAKRLENISWLLLKVGDHAKIPSTIDSARIALAYLKSYSIISDDISYDPVVTVTSDNSVSVKTSDHETNIIFIGNQNKQDKNQLLNKAILDHYCLTTDLCSSSTKLGQALGSLLSQPPVDADDRIFTFIIGNQDESHTNCKIILVEEDNAIFTTCTGNGDKLLGQSNIEQLLLPHLSSALSSHQQASLLTYEQGSQNSLIKTTSDSEISISSGPATETALASLIEERCTGKTCHIADLDDMVTACAVLGAEHCEGLMGNWIGTIAAIPELE